jgi:hypothetical protein
MSNDERYLVERLWAEIGARDAFAESEFGIARTAHRGRKYGFRVSKVLAGRSYFFIPDGLRAWLLLRPLGVTFVLRAIASGSPSESKPASPDPSEPDEYEFCAGSVLAPLERSTRPRGWHVLAPKTADDRRRLAALNSEGRVVFYCVFDEESCSES